MESISQSRIKNRPRVIALTFTGLIFVFIFLIFLPYIIDMDGMNGGFALSFLSLFFAIICLVVAIVYFGLAKKFARVTSGDNLIVCWNYERDEWLRFTENEFKFEKNQKRMLLLLIGVIAFIIFTIFAIVDPEVWRAMLAAFFGLMALLSIFAFLIPWLNYRTRKKSSYELYLSKNGVYIGGSFHVWGFLGSKLENIGFNEKDMQITLEYSYPTRTGLSYETVHIPVPASKIEVAKNAAKTLASLAQ